MDSRCVMQKTALLVPLVQVKRGFPTMTGATNVDAVYNLRVKVCDSTAGLESNCNVSTNKPEGLLQHYARQMRFGLFSYAMQGNSDINRDGGVLKI